MKANYFTILWFLPYIDMNQPWVYTCPSILKLPYLSPHPHPLGCPRAPPLSALLHASNLHWSSILQSFVFTLVLTSYVCCITCTGLLTECFSLNQKFIFDSRMEMSNKPNPGSLCKNLPILSSTLWIANKYLSFKKY